MERWYVDGKSKRGESIYFEVCILQFSPEIAQLSKNQNYNLFSYILVVVVLNGDLWKEREQNEKLEGDSER